MQTSALCGQGQGVEADVRRLVDDLLVKALKTRHPTGACIMVPLGGAQITVIKSGSSMRWRYGGGGTK